MINRNIDDLSSNFKPKVIDFLAECKEKWFNIMVFEWLRTQERQKELYAQWRTKPWKIVTWTLKSNHLTGNAVDIVFKDSKWNPTWSWDYDSLIAIAKKYWIRNLKPKETAHFEDDWTIYKPMKSKYTDILAQELKTSNLSPIFSSYEWDSPLTERETKELIEIALIRNRKRL